MNNQPEDILKQSADILYEAENKRKGSAPLTGEIPGLSIEDAYKIQILNIDKKSVAGHRITGKKIGLTSVAMQESLGVNEPDYGHLLDNMIVENNGSINKELVMQPRVEAEIAFVLKESLEGPNVSTLDVLQATDYIVPALEIVDSRVKDWNIKLPDTIADNASSGLYILGDQPVPVSKYNIKQIGMALYQNGKLCNTGVGAAALGDPAYCIAWLANKLSKFNITLKAGEVILSGALSAAISAEQGDYFQARFANLGTVSVRFTS